MERSVLKPHGIGLDLILSRILQLWSWGVNDEGALGREVNNVPNPEKLGENFEREDLESVPMPVVELERQKFRPVIASVGDSLTIAVGADGHAKGWGIFRVSTLFLHNTVW